MSGIKHDLNKPDYSLLPWDTLEEVVKVLSFGARKYSRDNWKELDDLKNRYLAATLRHISAYARGEKHDEESELEHLSHAIVNLMFLSEFEKSEKKNEKY